MTDATSVQPRRANRSRLEFVMRHLVKRISLLILDSDVEQRPCGETPAADRLVVARGDRPSTSERRYSFRPSAYLPCCQGPSRGRGSRVLSRSPTCSRMSSSTSPRWAAVPHVDRESSLEIPRRQ